MAKTDLTAQRVREVLHYDPDTGIFTWAAQLGGRAKIGNIAGCVNKHPTQGYRLIRIDDHLYKAARLAWLYVHGYWPAHDIDHIDGVRHNDRIDNLREATRSLNNENQRRARSNNKSGFLGVHHEKRSGKWTANIKKNGKTKYLGMFDTPIAAHNAYVAAKRRLHTFGMI